MTEKPVKKTVAIPQAIDGYIRETWAILIENKVPNATYSAALNFMLLAAISEAGKKKGWGKEARDNAWSFARDRETLEQLKLHAILPLFEKHIQKQETDGSDPI